MTVLPSEENNNDAQNHTTHVNLPSSTSLSSSSARIKHGPTQRADDTKDGGQAEITDIKSRAQKDKDTGSLPEFPVRNYATLHFMLIMWSIIGFAIVAYYQVSHSHLEEFLNLEGVPVSMSGIFLYLGTFTALIVGVNGIVYAIRGTSLFYQVEQHLSGVIAGFYLLGLIYAWNSWGSHSKDTINFVFHQRTFEATTLANGSSYFKVLGPRYKTYWDRLQRVFRCCGFEGPQNWLDSEYGCLPKSCCADSQRRQCEEKLKVCTSQQRNPTVSKNQIWQKVKLA